MSIELNHITKTFGKQKAVDDITFMVGNGEIVGFIGPNGAGKSTTMKIITGYLSPISGTARVKGLDVAENKLEIRKLIGYLPEHNPLYTEMYIIEYLEYVAGIYKLGKQTRDRIRHTVQETGLEAEIHKKIGQLSKGYRQRVGLAQALIHDPEVLILDEPTSGLDPNQILEIRNLISRIGKEKTVLLSTHIMQEVEAICDRVVIINRGRIVADGVSTTLVEGGKATQTIVVEFSKEADKEKLEKIPGVNKAMQSDQNTWLLEADPSRDVRTEVFNFAVSRSMTILSLQKKEKSLEEVFQELTK